MSTTVTYKGNTLTTVNNTTKTLKTAGKYMEGNVILTDTTVDLSSDTVTPETLMQGYTAHDKSGAAIIGTATGGSMIIRDTEDSHGGTVRTITAGSVITGTKMITENGIYDVAEFADADVNVPAPEPKLQAKTATPSTSQQVVKPDSAYDGLSQVTVGAISSTYVGSGITRRSSTDLTASGATVTVPAGYYAEQASKAVQNGLLRSTETYQVAPEMSVDSSGLVTADVTQSGNTTPVYTSGWIGNDATQYVPVTAYNTLQLSTQAAKTVTPSTSQQMAVAAGRYTTGAVTVAAMPSGTAGTPTATKGTVSNHSVTITPSVTNTTGYITGSTKSGTAVTVAASELVSGTLNITSSGTKDVTNYANVSVAAGSATASVTKGSVSNHAITVTPSVTRTAGYITTGTANGTAVTVSASELVSGTLEITESGTYDVTNYASTDVNVNSGATNFIQGTFTTSSTTGSAQTINIPYTGTGYPVIAHIEVSGGFNNSDNTEWYNAIRQSSVGLWHMSKSNHNTDFKNYDTGDIFVVSKSSSTNANQYSSDHNVATYYAQSYGAGSFTVFEVVTFTSKTQLSVFVSDSGTRGLMPGINYSYFIVYSEQEVTNGIFKNYRQWRY